MEYIGTRKKRLAGRIGFMVSFSHKSNRYDWGFYKTEKEAAKAYDLFVIRKGFKRKTNFFKKSLCN